MNNHIPENRTVEQQFTDNLDDIISVLHYLNHPYGDAMGILPEVQQSLALQNRFQELRKLFREINKYPTRLANLTQAGRLLYNLSMGIEMPSLAQIYIVATIRELRRAKQRLIDEMQVRQPEEVGNDSTSGT